MIKVKKITTLRGHKSAIYTLSLGSNNNFYSCGGDGYIINWQLDNLGTGTVLATVPTQIFSNQWLPQKNHMLTGQMLGGIHVVDLNVKKEIKLLAHHQKSIFDIKLLDDEHFIAASGDGTLSICSLENYSIVKMLKISSKDLRSMDFHPTRQEMAVGCSDNHIYIIHTGNHKIKQVLKRHQNSVFTVKYDPKGEYLLSGARDAHLCIWNVKKNYALDQSFAAHLFTINDIAFSPNGKLFATASRDKTIKIWDAGNFELLKVIDKGLKLSAHINSVNKLLWSNYKDYLISCSDDRSIMIWEIIV